MTFYPIIQNTVNKKMIATNKIYQNYIYVAVFWQLINEFEIYDAKVFVSQSKQIKISNQFENQMKTLISKLKMPKIDVNFVVMFKLKLFENLNDVEFGERFDYLLSRLGIIS